MRISCGAEIVPEGNAIGFEPSGGAHADDDAPCVQVVHQLAFAPYPECAVPPELRLMGVAVPAGHHADGVQGAWVQRLQGGVVGDDRLKNPPRSDGLQERRQIEGLAVLPERTVAHGDFPHTVPAHPVGRLYDESGEANESFD